MHELELELELNSDTPQIRLHNDQLANTIRPSILLPIGFRIYGARRQFYLQFIRLALASLLIWFGALLAFPICYTYIVEYFLHRPVDAAVSVNAYRVLFGLLSVFIITDWEDKMGVGWMGGGGGRS